MEYQGILSKMATALDQDNLAHYHMQLGQDAIMVNDLIGQKITLTHTGNKYCIACQVPLKKTYQQGYCFLCTRRLAQCDICIVRPELCHYHKGTCREPQWGEKHCMQDHRVYLSNASGLKVGITKAPNIPSRWIDQGAIMALEIIQTKTRYQCGLVEAGLKAYFNDKTNWRKMLQNQVEDLDLQAIYQEHHKEISAVVDSVNEKFNDQVVWMHADPSPQSINYKVLDYPEKITSLNFDKNPCIEDTLVGIKAQYLIFKSGVINIRKFAGYEVILSTS